MTPLHRKKRKAVPIGSFALLALEVVVYAGLVAVYLVVALAFLRPLLLDAFEHHRGLYSALAVLLMLGQGLLLEVLTTLLVGFFVRARRDEGLSTPGFGE